MIVELISFGFKYGNPPASNYVIDVRFLNNPFYVDELKELTGLDEKVISFFERDEGMKVFLKNLLNWTKFLLKANTDAKKEKVLISIGCTGGQHRSPYVVENLAQFIMNEQITSALSVCHNQLEQGNKKILK